MSWCLQWSHVAWHRAGGVDLAGSDGRRARYAWLRPLELLWVDRTLESGQDSGQLRGRRSVERWRKAGRQEPNFAMSPDQFRRYRQVGIYGAYRVVLRTVPGLTMGDGWTLANAGSQLASLVNDGLPRDARLKQKNFENGTKWGRWRNGDEARYWVERGWPAWVKTGGFLPTPNDAISKRLPEEERRLLESVLFGAESIRRVTAVVLANAKGARSHADLCDALATRVCLRRSSNPGCSRCFLRLRAWPTQGCTPCADSGSKSTTMALSRRPPSISLPARKNFRADSTWFARLEPRGCACRKGVCSRTTTLSRDLQK